jgi:hypothetical protein
MKISNTQIGKYLLELFIVSFGVFLGMVVSDWDYERSMKKKTEQTRLYLIHEIKENVEKLDQAIDYHAGLVPITDSLFKNLGEGALYQPYFESDNQVFKIPGWQGLGLAELEDVIFETSKMTQVLPEFSLRTIHLLSRSYKKQQTYQDLSRTVTNRFFEMDSKTKLIDVMGNIEMMTGDILEAERFLLSKLNETLKLLETESY